MKQKLVDVWFQVTENLLGNLPGMLGLVAAVGIFALAGAVLSKDRMPILMTLRGWAFATMLAMTLPLIGIRSLTVMLVFMGGMATTGIWRLRGHPIETRGLIPSLVLGAPLIVLSAAAPSIFWDSYAHWLPNAQYLVQTNQLISAPLPHAFYSMHPTYPPALAVPIYVASRLTGQFAIGAAETLSSVILVLTVQQFVVAFQQDGRQQVVGANRTWATTLVALMATLSRQPRCSQFQLLAGQPRLALLVRDFRPDPGGRHSVDATRRGHAPVAGGYHPWKCGGATPDPDVYVAVLWHPDHCAQARRMGTGFGRRDRISNRGRRCWAVA